MGSQIIGNEGILGQTIHLLLIDDQVQNLVLSELFHENGRGRKINDNQNPIGKGSKQKIGVEYRHFLNGCLETFFKYNFFRIQMEN